MSSSKGAVSAGFHMLANFLFLPSNPREQGASALPARQSQIRLVQAAEQPDQDKNRDWNADKPQQKIAPHILSPFNPENSTPLRVSSS
jgi:hypothetical protein